MNMFSTRLLGLTLATAWSAPENVVSPPAPAGWAFQAAWSEEVVAAPSNTDQVSHDLSTP